MLRKCLKDVYVFLVKTEETSKNSTWNSFSAWCPLKCDTYLYKPANLFKNAWASRGHNVSLRWGRGHRGMTKPNKNKRFWTWPDRHVWKSVISFIIIDKSHFSEKKLSKCEDLSFWSQNYMQIRTNGFEREVTFECFFSENKFIPSVWQVKQKFWVINGWWSCLNKNMIVR